jgi:serine/threonine protein kinase/Tol biopolymer transport system component
MNLASGTRLGPYEILAPAGAGGMGEVYKAKDTRLDRLVAIKILPAHLSDDPERRQRFEREARAISALNHPSICMLHDVGHQDGVDFLVMEYLEGESLAERLAKGALPTDQVIRIGSQVADALDRAHRQGVIHRDLKPGNIVLTKNGAKLLDFGLAKVLEPASGAVLSTMSALPTERRDLTAQGTLLGTLQYMAPEQLEGKEADPRTDIFALGMLIYEMAAGQKAFEGKSQASLIAAILEREPAPLSIVKPDVPPALARLVKICLAKEPEDRWQTAHDVALQLRWIAEGGSLSEFPAVAPQRRKGRERFWMAVAAAASVAALALLAFILIKPEPPRTLLQFSLFPPEKTSWTPFNSMALSPDGRKLVFYADSQDGLGRLWLRPMDSAAAQPLPGTEIGNASFPFWSPDSRFVGFFAERKLKRIDATGGGPQTLCDSEDMSGGTWNKEGIILFSPAAKRGILKIPAAGGSPTAVTQLDDSRQETSHLWPVFLPDGKHFLFLARSAKPELNSIFVGSLDGGKPRLLLNSDSGAVFAPPRSILFMRGGSLQAQEFDPGRQTVSGEPRLIAENVGMNLAYHYGAFTASANGMLAFRSGTSGGRELLWIDRRGTRGEPLVPVSNFVDPDLSPDGKRVVLALGDVLGTRSEIWIVDLVRAVSTKLTFNPVDSATPVWSPDGKHIYYTSRGEKAMDIFRKAADGSDEQTLIYASEGDKAVEDISPDARYLLFDSGVSTGNFDLWMLPLEKGAAAVPLVKTASQEGGGRVSPDGKWVAYVSDESGEPQIYLRSFPHLGGKWQVSARGGAQPRWSRNGKEIYYLGIDGSFQVVSVQTDGSTPQIGGPVQLFTRSLNIFSMRNHYTPAPDGQRFLFTLNASNAGPVPMTVMVNWDAENPR